MIKARNSAATPDARTKNKRVCYSSTLAHLAKTAQKKRGGKDTTPTPARRLAVSSCHFAGFMEVVSGRAGWDEWGGCSDKRCPRNMASAAENRRRRRHVAVERAPEHSRVQVAVRVVPVDDPDGW